MALLASPGVMIGFQYARTSATAFMAANNGDVGRKGETDALPLTPCLAVRRRDERQLWPAAAAAR